jgi:pimeloyl-ACP methyl ester carboxylesterase
MTTAVLGITLGLCLTSDMSAVDPHDFQEWFTTASQGRLRMPKEVTRAAKAFRYVFVGGFGNEYLVGYFAQNAHELRTQGVPRGAIHFIHPSSSRTVDDNLDSVREEMVRIAATGPERLVVIAHSRGACDALAFALRNPQFVHDRIEALFLVQGPFGGTGLADYLQGGGQPIDGRMPPVQRWLVYQLGRVMQNSMEKRGWREAIGGLKREPSQDYWSHCLAEHAAAIPLVGPKVFFIATRARPSRLGWFHKVTSSYLNAYYGPNDGIVTLDDQHLPGLGTCLGPVDAGHADLTCRFPMTTAGKRYRKALVLSILMAVGQAARVTQAATADRSDDAHRVRQPAP